MKSLFISGAMPLFTVMALAWPMAAAAQASAHGAHDSPAPSAAPTLASARTLGEVRRIDLANQKITLRHEEISHLQMPPMTMVFKVRDPSLLQQVSVGDSVRFIAEKKGGEYWVIELQRNP